MTTALQPLPTRVHCEGVPYTLQAQNNVLNRELSGHKRWQGKKLGSLSVDTVALHQRETTTPAQAKCPPPPSALVGCIKEVVSANLPAHLRAPCVPFAKRRDLKGTIHQSNRTSMTDRSVVHPSIL